ncbi:MAG: PAS domain-containing protein, partial [Halobacteriales archaeon]|nr:PAS domain-containing protein [Halobacteriales archaeon]
MIIDDELDDPGLLLEQFAGQSPDVFWMMSADWEHLVFINDSYEDLYGRSVETLAEDSLDFLNGIHPDFHEMVKHDMGVLAEGQPIDHEYRVNPGEDFERWVWATGRPVYEDGELTRLAGFVRDITDRKRRQAAIEERERTIREIYDVTSDSGESFEAQVRRLLEIGCGILGTRFGTLSRIDGEAYEFQIVHPPGAIDEGSVTPLPETNCERTVVREETLILADIGEDSPDLATRAGNLDWGIETYIGAPVF